MLKKILGKLQALGGEEIALRKYIRQLSILARLRNLIKETQRQVTDLGLLYDITKDYLHQEGLTKGIEEGLTKGRQEEKREFVISLLEDKAYSIEKIARLAKVGVAYVEAIAKEMRK